VLNEIESLNIDIPMNKEKFRKYFIKEISAVTHGEGYK